MSLAPVFSNEYQVWWQHHQASHLVEVLISNFSVSKGSVPVALVLKIMHKLLIPLPHRVSEELLTHRKKTNLLEASEPIIPLEQLVFVPPPTSLLPVCERDFLRPSGNGLLLGVLGRLREVSSIQQQLLTKTTTTTACGGTTSTPPPAAKISSFAYDLLLGLLLGGQVDALNSLSRVYVKYMEEEEEARKSSSSDTPSISREVSSMSDLANNGGGDDGMNETKKREKNPRVVVVKPPLEWLWTDDWNSFHIAACCGHGRVTLENLWKIYEEVSPFSSASVEPTNHLLRQATKTEEKKTPLLVATEVGNNDAIDFFLKILGTESLLHWLDPGGKNTETEANRLALAAAKFGRGKTLELLHRSYDIDPSSAMSQQGKNALHLATQENQIEIVPTLVRDLKMDVNFGTLGKGCSAMFIAAEKNHAQMIRTLAQHGGDVNLAKHGGWTPFLAAVERDHREAIEALVSLNADVNLCNDYGMSSVFVAAHEGHADLVRYLVNKLGADIHAKRRDGWTAVTAAAYKNQPEIVRFLHSEGASVNVGEELESTSTPTVVRTTFSPAHIAAQGGHLEALRVLHELGANMNAIVADGWTPLLFAANRGQADTCKVLVDDLGADVNAQTNNGVSSLSMAAQVEDLAVIKALASVGADLEAADDQGLSPVSIAAYVGKERSITVLHSLGANIKTADNWPMRLAFQNNHPNVMDLLVRLGAKPLPSYGFGLNRCRTCPDDDDE